MLDDAAQALGARYQGRPGRQFRRRRPLQLRQGQEHHDAAGRGARGGLRTNVRGTRRGHGGAARGVPPSGTLATLCKLPVYSLLLRPWLYGAVRRLPLGLGLTPFDDRLPDRALQPHAGGPCSPAAGSPGRDQWNPDTQRRPTPRSAGRRAGPCTGACASRCRARVREISGALDPRRIGRGLITALERAGIGATASYPRALVDVPEVACRLPPDQRPTPGAREVASRIVTLPTHGFSPADLGQRVAAVARGHA